MTVDPEKLRAWLEQMIREHSPPGGSDLATAARLADAAAALQRGSGMVFGLVLPREGVAGRQEHLRRARAALADWFDHLGPADQEALATLVIRHELDVPIPERVSTLADLRATDSDAAAPAAAGATAGMSLLGWVRSLFGKKPTPAADPEPPDTDRPVAARSRAGSDVSDFSDKPFLVSLPATGAGRIVANGCTKLTTVPAGLSCNELHLVRTAIRTLPADIRVRHRLDLTDCAELESLPAALAVGSLILRGCTRLSALPADLSVTFLDLDGCTALTSLPGSLRVRGGRLSVRNCTGLSALPAGLGPLSQLDVSGCENLTRLPDDLVVTSWIDLGRSSLTALPDAVRDTQLRWRGVAVDHRVAFHPEQITAQEVLAERNAELRRIKMERMGFDRFVRDADAEVVDQDSDPGGARKLLRVRLEGDEDLVCVSVQCPSTGRHYVIRVPPAIQTCRHAAAWLAGFDSPDELELVQET